MCKYCENVKKMAIIHFERLVYKDATFGKSQVEQQLIRPINDDNRFYLTYCPFCGKKIGENNV